MIVDPFKLIKESGWAYTPTRKEREELDRQIRRNDPQGWKAAHPGRQRREGEKMASKKKGAGVKKWWARVHKLQKQGLSLSKAKKKASSGDKRKPHRSGSKPQRRKGGGSKSWWSRVKKFQRQGLSLSAAKRKASSGNKRAASRSPRRKNGKKNPGRRKAATKRKPPTQPQISTASTKQLKEWAMQQITRKQCAAIVKRARKKAGKLGGHKTKQAGLFPWASSAIGG